MRKNEKKKKKNHEKKQEQQQQRRRRWDSTSFSSARLLSSSSSSSPLLAPPPTTRMTLVVLLLLIQHLVSSPTTAAASSEAAAAAFTFGSAAAVASFSNIVGRGGGCSIFGSSYNGGGRSSIAFLSSSAARTTTSRSSRKTNIVVGGGGGVGGTCVSCTSSSFSIVESKIPTNPTSSNSNNDDDNLLVERNKKVGCGIPPLSSGTLFPFDPNDGGKLSGTNLVHSRIEHGSSFASKLSSLSSSSSSSSTTTTTTLSSSSTTTTTTRKKLEDAQHWLEDLGVPLNTIKNSSPVEGRVIGNGKLIGDNAPGDIRHVVIQLPPDLHYIEGQCISIIPPGVDNKGRKHKPRLYSIASTRYGDLLNGSTVSLCVRRAEYYDPKTGLIDPSKKGICSHFLCDSNVGTQVSISGPVGKTMLLPDNVENADVIMVATGTGIAPFRAFLHRLFMENTMDRHMFMGNAWLVLGVPTTSGLLYHEEFTAMQENASQPKQLQIDYAISREMKNQSGDKLYVQDVLNEKAEELFQRLNNGAHVYFCGLKGMMPPILTTLEEASSKRGIEWSVFLKELKKEGRWHVEVY